MNTQFLKGMYELTGYFTTRNTAGLTHEQSVHEPETGGNSMNWVLGHVVYWRNTIAQLLGEDPVWQDDEHAWYRGNPGARLTEPPPATAAVAAERGDVVPLDELIETFQTLQGRIVRGIERQNGDVAAALTDGPLGKVVQLHTHEAYHVGQLGLLRRLAGESGTV